LTLWSHFKRSLTFLTFLNVGTCQCMACPILLRHLSLSILRCPSSSNESFSKKKRTWSPESKKYRSFAWNFLGQLKLIYFYSFFHCIMLFKIDQRHLVVFRCREDSSVFFRVHFSNEIKTRVSKRTHLITSQEIFNYQNPFIPKLKERRTN